MRELRQQGFTLLEVLATVCIIGMLMALLLPAIGAIRRAAERSRAHGDVLALVTAVKQYRDTYSKWPNQTQGTTDTTYQAWALVDVIACLTNVGQRVVDGRGNVMARKEGFIRIPAESMVSNCFVDPWRRPYVLAMDENADGLVSLSATCHLPTVVTGVMARAVAFSWGRNPSSASDRVYSWVY